MPEKVTFTAPQVGPTITDVEVIGLEMWTKPTPTLRIVVMDSIGGTISTYYGPSEDPAQDALTLIRGLNKANLSTKSLQRRLLEKLQADGKLAAGNVTGTPD